LSPNFGSAEEISNAILSSNIYLSRAMAVGCDGTTVNTGYENGLVRKLEEKLKKELQ